MSPHVAGDLIHLAARIKQQDPFTSSSTQSSQNKQASKQANKPQDLQLHNSTVNHSYFFPLQLTPLLQQQ